MVNYNKEEEGIPLTRLSGDASDTLNLAFCNQRSRLRHDKADESTTFFFDYSTESGRGETIDWKVLKKLKNAKKIGIIRHPYILNWINQKLKDCALFYTMHFMASLAFFFLLASHIFSRNLLKDVLITIFTFVFFMFLVLKGTVKARISKSVSKWFIVAFFFNLLTYLATFAYVWLPTLFEMDDYHQETKKLITWFLPIVAIISAWANFLFIMRKSPFGKYIFMMTRILKSFAHIGVIWLPTLIAFSFAFLLIMRDTGVKPWPLIDQQSSNMTMMETVLVILQAITKTSTMMIGEVDANDILDTNQWIPSILVLVFEIITVILLMNLMVSLAVGDVNDLKNSSQGKLLKIKVNFVIEALQLSEQFQFQLHLNKTQGVLVVQENDYYTVDGDFPKEELQQEKDESFKISMQETGVKLRIRTKAGRVKTGVVNKCDIECVETSISGIPVLQENPDAKTFQNVDNCWDTFAKWLIGLDLDDYLDL